MSITRIKRDGLLIAIFLAFMGLVAAAIMRRSFELDEGYTLLLLTGHPHVIWPAGVFHRADIADWFDAPGSIRAIIANLRQWDVHPPLWFLFTEGWRRLVGTGLAADRVLSALFGVADFILFALLVALCRAPRWAMAFCFLSYGVVYCASTLRMYPLALGCILAGTLLTIIAMRGRTGWAFAAGLVFGLGVLTHMLVAFMAAFVCGTAILATRRWMMTVWIGLGAILPVVYAASFYVVQDRRNWQFPIFTWRGMVTDLAQQWGAALLGGTPYYGPRYLFVPLAIALAVLLFGAITLVLMSWRRITARPEGWVLLVGAVAMPITLLGLGIAFDRVPVTSRYLTYSLPFQAILLAIAVGAGGWRTGFASLFVIAQIVGALGLPFARVAQQDARPSIAEITRLWQPNAVLLLPQASDTTGMTATWAYEAPKNWALALITTDESREALQQVVAGRPEVFLSGQGDDKGEVAIAHAHTMLAELGWTQQGMQGGQRANRGPKHLWFRYIKTEHEDQR